MSFFSKLVHGVTHAVGQVVHTVEKIVKNPIVDAVAGTALALTGVGAPIVAGIEGAAKAVGNAVNDATGGVIGKVIDSVSGAAQGAGGVVQEVEQFINGISTTLKNFDDNVVEPIVKPIASAITEIKALNQELHADIKGGIEGILRIPRDISDALGSFDAVLGRSIAALGQNSADIAQHIIAPSIQHAGAVPIQGLTEAIGGLANKPEPGAPFLHSIDITEPQAARPLADITNELYTKLQSESGVWGWIISRFMDLISWEPLIAAYIAPQEEIYKSEAFKVLPTKPLDPATVIAALLRGVATADSANEELLRNGIDASRQAILKEMSHPLPDVGALAQWRDRNLLSATDYIDIMRRLGYDETDAQRFWFASHAVPGMADIMGFYHRRLAAQEGLASDTLNQLPPEGVVDDALYAGISPEAVAAAWIQHWQFPSIQIMSQALFRGYITHAAFTASMDQQAVPKEFQQLMLDIQRPLVQFRTIPGLVSAGIWSESKGIDELKRHGYSDEDSTSLITYALKKAKGQLDNGTTKLHTLSQGEVMAAYDDGIIDRQHAHDLLVSHNVESQAAEVMLLLADLKIDRMARKDAVDTLIAQIETGTLTQADAITQLNSIGLTGGEVTKAMARIDRVKLRASKLPSLSDVEKFFKKGIIDVATAGQTLSQIGYSDEWVNNYLTLWGATADASTTTDTTQ